MKYACPCCSYLTFDEMPAGSFDICPVCYWEDDPVQSKDPNFVGGANGVSLIEAKANFLKFGAVKKECQRYVRQPLPEEVPK
ncbi:CPCC family cysteine-rich protein [Sneathiella litorea]|uniref:Hydrolase n=1 Tax=Sneathiella litorea TaxID=2606216 RepID=A0A6L8W9Q4_9PROT|nr:CPCC family cysteine-rich protein [Sneathiella litorea]MZR30947.1 hydrolase [Sneathiella litorea]